MIITRDNENIIIKPNEAINMAAVQQLIDYINVLEIASEKQGSEADAAALADEVDKKWWAENKRRFLKWSLSLIAIFYSARVLQLKNKINFPVFFLENFQICSA